MNDATATPPPPAGLQANNSRPRSRGRPFQAGVSGNPAGRRRGTASIAAAIKRLLTRREAEAVAKQLLSMAKGGDLQAMRLLLDRTDGPVSAMNVECFADATISPRVEFILPDNGRDKPPEKMTDDELDRCLSEAVRQGVPDLLFAQSDRGKALLAASRPQDASQTGTP